MMLAVCITIDTEADHDTRWYKTSPLTFRSITEGIPRILGPLFRQHGAHPTYLLTTEVLDHPESVAVLRREPSCELGTHLHGDHVEPELRIPAEGAGSYDYTCFYPPEVEREKIRTITRQFIDRFGYAPTTYRAGRYAASATTARSLAELGYTVDTSVTPGVLWTNEKHPEQRLDFRNAPLFPYHPSADDLAVPGALPIWEVPVTIVPFPRTVRALLAAAERVRGAPVRAPSVWLRPSTSTLPENLYALKAALAASRSRRTTVLNVMFHSMEVIAGASPYSSTSAEAARIVRRLDHLLRVLRSLGAKFVPLGAVPELVSEPVSTAAS